MREIRSNMTGTVLAVHVKVGDSVKAGTDLISIESMKMEMLISSESEGKVSQIKVQVEDFVQEGQVVVVLE